MLRYTLLLTLLACSKDPEDTNKPPEDSGGVDSIPPSPTDEDGDGVAPGDGDCDDANPAVFPGNSEVCNGLDDNCNTVIDEGFADTDGDATPDCLDAETCDGLDNNGDGSIDEGFTDTDGDATPDCLDAETCDGLDNNGDGSIDEGQDSDGDGFLPCEDDCDDTDAAISPAASEVQDGADNDCDSMVDEGAWAAGDLMLTEVMVNPQKVADNNGEWIEVYNTTGQTIYLNGLVIQTDVATYQIPREPLVPLPSGIYMVIGSNANPDANGGVTVSATWEELLLSNESGGISLWMDGVELDRLEWDDGETMPDPAGASLSLDAIYLDATSNNDPGVWCAARDLWGDDTDAGSPGAANELCSTVDHDGDGFTGDEGDCDDDDPAISPISTEVWYDGVDQDCAADDDFDQDHDGHIASDFGGDDCDDTNAAIAPSLPEVCDDANIDEDCSGLADDDDVGVTALLTWYPDADGDSYGTEIDAVQRCEGPAGYVTNTDDCDDTDSAISPDATEVCGDGADNDCDGSSNGCGISGDVDTDSADVSLEGVSGSDQAGASIAGVGDLNGDGWGDLVVGASRARSGGSQYGSAYLILGPLTSGSLGDATVALRGERSGDQAGVAVAGGQDYDGDGVLDYVVGAQTAMGSMNQAGAAYVISGGFTVSTDLGTAATATLLGERSTDAASFSLAMLPDITGDTFPDVLVGAPFRDASGSDSGTAYLVAGGQLGDVALSGATASLRGEASNDQAGTSVDGAGDLDGDGVNELAIGAPAYSVRDTGAVYLFSTAPTGSVSLSTADVRLEGSVNSGEAGTSVSTGADIDGDGNHELIIGAPASTTGAEGRVYVATGPFSSGSISAMSTLYGAQPGDEIGYAVKGADIDGDGFGDLVIGAYSSDLDGNDTGRVYIVYGPVAGSMDLSAADAILFGASTSSFTGRSVDAADVNDDPFLDVLVGSFGANSSAGMASVYYGGIGY